VLSFSLATAVPVAAAGPWYVDGSVGTTGDGTSASPFLTIGEAITTATDGDTINVAAGTYNGNVAIDKSLTLQGAGAATTIIVGVGSTAAVTITADSVTIDGFTVKNPTGSSPPANTFGIYAVDQSNITITNNIVTNIGNSSNKAMGIVIISNTAAVDAITITDNQISYIASGGDDGTSDPVGYSASGISIG